MRSTWIEKPGTGDRSCECSLEVTARAPLVWLGRVFEQSGHPDLLVEANCNWTCFFFLPLMFSLITYLDHLRDSCQSFIVTYPGRLLDATLVTRCCLICLCESCEAYDVLAKLFQMLAKI